MVCAKVLRNKTGKPASSVYPVSISYMWLLPSNSPGLKITARGEKGRELMHLFVEMPSLLREERSGG